MDNDKSNIIYLIAYQRKALRLLDLGLSNQSVTRFSIIVLTRRKNCCRSSLSCKGN